MIAQWVGAVAMANRLACPKQHTNMALHQYRQPGGGCALAGPRFCTAGDEESQAQQDVGSWLRKSPAAMRRLSAMVKYGAQVSARSSTVMPDLMA